MYNGLLHLHSVLRWFILILLLVAIYKSMTGRNNAFTPGHKKIGLFLMICADLMFILGLYQWFTGTWGLKSIQTNGMGTVMKNASLRFFAIEHMVGMLVAIALIHIGYTYSKRDIPDSLKHKRSLLFYALALLIILVFIPWPFRTVGAGRAWFPGV